MLPERFESKFIPEPNTGCWLWLSSVNPGGYGEYLPGRTLGADGRRNPTVRAHRYAYEQVRGPIPPGLQLDHLCRVRSCVNPDHLEPVTNHENVLRGWATGERTVTRCKRGHELSGENLYCSPGRRHCRTCRAERAADLQRAKTHCKFGHAWTDQVGPKGRRICVACRTAGKEASHG